ncbi:MAG TPA: hypothetical protein PKH39_16640 [Woeseiaceae bacterium]|nr:hypothetical protein [Woeseiaceae bacterium]
MENLESQHIGDTIRIRRPPKVFTDYLGRTIWMSGVEPCEVKLEIDFESEGSRATDPYNRTSASFA